jgi:hypothetical protein
MADNVTLPGTGSVVETREQADGSERQVITLGSAESAALLALLQRVAAPTWHDPSIGALRVQLQTGASNIGVVAAVTAVTTLNQLGSISAAAIPLDSSLTAWASALRGRIT